MILGNLLMIIVLTLVPDARIVWEAPTTNEDGSPIGAIHGYEVVLTQPGTNANDEIATDIVRTRLTPGTEMPLSTLIGDSPVPAGKYDIWARTVTGDSMSSFSGPVAVTIGDETSPPSSPVEWDLLDEDFSDLLGWTVDGGNWAISDGTVRQSGNLGNALLFYQPSIVWSDYTFEVDVRADDNDWIGVLFRVKSVSNYYRYRENVQGSRRQLEKIVNGAAIILKQETGITPHIPGDPFKTWHIEAKGDQIKVLVDGQEVFSVTDSTHTEGGIGLYCSYEDGAEFRHPRVGSFKVAAPLPPPPPPIDLTPVQNQVTELKIVLTEIERNLLIAQSRLEEIRATIEELSEK